MNFLNHKSLRKQSTSELTKDLEFETDDDLVDNEYFDDLADDEDLDELVDDEDPLYNDKD